MTGNTSVGTPPCLANPDQLSQLRHSVVTDAQGQSWRAIDAAIHGGLALRVLPDRGFDVSHATWAGIPLAWIGRRGEAPPLAELHGQDWERHFTGGLMATCGLANVGEESEGHAQHGRINHMRAEDIQTRRQIEGDRITLHLSAVIHEHTLDDGLFRMERQIVLSNQPPHFAVTDRVTNLADGPRPAPFLYHINLGWPLVDPKTTVEIAGRQKTIDEFGDQRDLPGGWQRPGHPCPAGQPSVTVEHLIAAALDQGQAVIRSPGTGLAMTIRWDRSSLPRLFQWVDFQPDAGVLAIEPSNACTLGRHVDREKGMLVHLDAGESRITQMNITLEPLTTRAG